MQSNHHLKGASALLAAVLLLTPLAGCGTSTASSSTPAPATSSSEAPKELQKVTVNEVTHSVFYAPQYAAVNLGFFEEEGLEIELATGQGADKVMAAVLSGSVDIGFAGPEASIYVYNEGRADYPQIFAQLTQRDGSFLVAREPVENFDWASLAGAHILPGRKGGVPYMALMHVVRQKGLTPNVDVEFDDSIQFDLMAGAFLAGTGDYVALFEPVASTMEKEGKGYIVASVGAEAGEIPYTAYFTSTSFIEKNPETVQKFVNAVYRGQQWVATHTPEEIAAVIAPSFPDTDVELLTTVVRRYQEIDAWSTTPILKESSFDLLQEVISEAGELEQKAPYDKIVNNTFAQKAVDEVK